LKWLEIAIETPVEAVEAVSWILNEFETGGVVIEDPALFSGAGNEKSGQLTARNDAKLIVKGYLPINEHLQRRLVDIKKAVSRTGYEKSLIFSTTEVDEEDWATAWKSHYRTRRAGRRLVIKPVWEDYEGRPGDIIIEMDPGMAFGTGDHPTTVMCLEALEAYIKGGEKVYDVGTGSGILAVASALLGAREVVAVDCDPVALKSAAENVSRNRVDSLVRVVKGDLLKLDSQLYKPEAAEPAQIVVANITADAIIRLAPGAAGILSSGGIFIASGIIKERAGEVRFGLESAGFEIMEAKRQGGWICYLARRR